jgi:hypothetical protein
MGHPAIAYVDILVWVLGEIWMIDVHAPHNRMEGFKDFFLHLITITIGLLIALSLEGCVEWHHHRTLVREADAGLHAEIEQNSKVVAAVRQQIKDEEKQLDQDLAAMAVLRAHPDAKHQQIGFTFRLAGFDEVSWKTAQTTGAFAYMPYDDAQTYSDIYAAQDELYTVQQQVVADVMRAAALVVAQPDGVNPTPAQIDELTDRIGMVQMRLILLTSMVDVLDATYQKYRSEHPLSVSTTAATK